MEVAGATINRLCGSGLDAVGIAARAIKSGEARLVIAGGVESMSRAPFVMPKADSAFSRSNAVHDTTIGWRFINKQMKALHGVDSMPETAENVPAISGSNAMRKTAWHMPANKGCRCNRGRISSQRNRAGRHSSTQGEPTLVSQDEHPRATTLEALASSKAWFTPKAR